MYSSQEQLPKEVKRNEGESSGGNEVKANMDISAEQRQKIIVNMLLVIFQRRDIQLIRDMRMDQVISLVEKIENEIFMMSTSQENYKKLLVSRIKYLRSQLNDCFLKRHKSKQAGEFEKTREYGKTRDADADLEKLTRDVQTKIRLSDSTTKEVPLILSEEDEDKESDALVGKGPDGIPVMRTNNYSSNSFYSYAESERTNKNKRMADFDSYQPSAFIKTPNRVPENNLSDPYKVDNFDLDFILDQPESSESRKLVEELSEKVSGRHRNLSMMSGSPASSCDPSAASPCPSSADYNEQEYKDVMAILMKEVREIEERNFLKCQPPTTLQQPPGVLMPDLTSQQQQQLQQRQLQQQLQQQQQRQQQQQQLQEEQRKQQVLQQLAQQQQQQQKQQLLQKQQPQLQQPFLPQPTQPNMVSVNPISVVPVSTAIATPAVVTLTLTPQNLTKPSQRPILPKPPSPATATTTKVAQSPKNTQAPSPKRSSAVTTNVSPSNHSTQASSRPDRLAMACRKVARCGVEQLTTQDEDGDRKIFIIPQMIFVNLN